jgi:hypothetical protein
MKTMQNTLFGRLWRRWLALTLLVMMTACATGPRAVSHAFSFDGFNDKWADKVDLLAYAYGDQYHMVRNDVANPRSPVFAGLSKLPPGTGVNGPMPVGEFLRVKWRIQATGEVFEERVDLRDRLPKDMSDHELTFVIDGRQLYVYVVTPTPQKPSGRAATHRSWHSKYNVTYEVFPNREKASEK